MTKREAAARGDRGARQLERVTVERSGGVERAELVLEREVEGVDASHRELAVGDKIEAGTEGVDARRDRLTR